MRLRCRAASAPLPPPDFQGVLLQGKELTFNLEGEDRMELTFENSREEMKEALRLLNIAQTNILRASEQLPYMAPLSVDQETGEYTINASTDHAAMARDRLAIYRLRCSLDAVTVSLKKKLVEKTDDDSQPQNDQDGPEK